jgi:hypothetical protein
LKQSGGRNLKIIIFISYSLSAYLFIDNSDDFNALGPL